MLIEIANCRPSETAALGATLAERHMEGVYRGIVENKISKDELIILDFKGIEHVNGSYIKGTVLWLFLCGQMAANPPKAVIPPRHQTEPRPFPIYVAATNLSPALLGEFQDFLEPRKVPLMLVKKFNADVVSDIALIGHLDPVLRLTLNILAQQQKATAPILHGLFQNEKITVTAWNNRLNDLHALRLVRRVRTNRGWEYEPLAKKILWE